MGENSAIGWTDHTFNPWIGCSKVAAGCTNCYAEAFSKRTGRARWGDGGTRVVTSDANWKQPIKWNRAAEKEGRRRRVFCASLADVFEDWGGPILNHRGVQLGNDGNGQPLTMDDIRVRLFGLIDDTPRLDWLLLTKRPENIPKMWPWDELKKPTTESRRFVVQKRRNNVWLLTSVATQADVDRNAPLLLECRHLSPVLGLSCEPLLETIDLKEYIGELDWIIVGGESGPKRRMIGPWAIQWVANQCRSANKPCYVKQDVAMRPGQQGRISDATWAMKEFPCVPT